MKELAYNKAIFIKKFSLLKKYREVKLSTSFRDKNSLLLDINHFGYKETVSILGHLKNTLEGKYKYEYDWAGIRTSFESMQDKTVVEDMTTNDECFELDTTFVYKMMNDRKGFMSSLTENGVLLKVRTGFEAIKSDPKKFKYQENRYRFLSSEIELNYFLFPSDIELSTKDFMSTVLINKLFLKPLTGTTDKK